MKPLLLSLFIIAPLCAQTIDVTTLGATPDGVTDNTAVIQKAFAMATANPGTELYFPCSDTGSAYLVTSPLSIPGWTKILGSHGNACQIVYKPTNGVTAPAAFSLINVDGVKFENIALRSESATTPPSAIVMIGAVHGEFGQHSFVDVTIGGYATTAMVYSIASNANDFRGVRFELEGGGAQIGFYTSAADDLHICSGCGSSSNISLVLDRPDFDFTNSNLIGPVTAIEDKTEGGTGDHYYRNGHIALNGNPQSSGFTFVSGDQSHGGLNWKTSVRNFYIENGGNAFSFLKDYQPKVWHYDIEDVTWNTSTPGATTFIKSQAGLQLCEMRFVKNEVYNSTAPTQNGQSVVDSLTNSVVMEDYGAFSITRNALGNSFVMSGLGSVTLPPNTPVANNSFLQPGTAATN